MIINSFKELRVTIDRILNEMLYCTPEQIFQIERQVRSAHGYLAQRDVPPREALDRIGHMANMAAMQLEMIVSDAGVSCADRGSTDVQAIATQWHQYLSNREST